MGFKFQDPMYIVQSLGSRIHVQDPRSYCKIMCRSLIIVKRGAGLEMNNMLVEPSGDSLTSAGLSFVAKILIILIWGLSHIHWFVAKIGLLLFSSISHLSINFSLFSHLLICSPSQPWQHLTRRRSLVVPCWAWRLFKKLQWLVPLLNVLLLFTVCLLLFY